VYGMSPEMKTGSLGSISWDPLGAGKLVGVLEAVGALVGARVAVGNGVGVWDKPVTAWQAKEIKAKETIKTMKRRVVFMGVILLQTWTVG
jgi:hypothetical protein